MSSFKQRLEDFRNELEGFYYVYDLPVKHIEEMDNADIYTLAKEIATTEPTLILEWLVPILYYRCNLELDIPMYNLISEIQRLAIEL